MEKTKIGIIREGKVPPDHRVPLTPNQCKTIQTLYPNVEIIVQPSPVRAYKDEAYSAQGIRLNEDLSECDIIMGVKEVNIEDLIPNKKFIFFSHTLKKQPYNRNLLRAIIEKKIQLIDYEVIKNKQNKRIIGFGRYAGIVGTYNAFRTFGLKKGLFDIKPAYKCRDRKEMEAEMANIVLPSDTKIVLTGYGRVGHGAREVIDLLPIKEVSPEEFLKQKFTEPVFTQLEVEDYYGRIDAKPFVKAEFYSNPELFQSTFKRYITEADVYIPCHFWSNKSPFIVTKEDFRNPNLKLSVVADISCDIDGPIACTIRPSKIADPIYGYNPITEKEDDFMNPGVIAVMAVDNLPCELPLDASEDFGNELMRNVLPVLLKSDPDHIIERASETSLEGKLTEHFSYLQAYLEGVE
jgi:alanine dehydrogenase